MQRFVVNALALFGGFVLVGTLVGAVIGRLDDGAAGVVLGPGDSRLQGVPVFLDRGRGNAIERVTTDANGRFRLPLERHELRRAVWLICTPGGIPMVGSREENQLGSTTYGYTALGDSTWGFYRASGWRGPIPRECPVGTDSMGWRYPRSAGMHPSAFTAQEPDWPDVQRR